MKTTVRFRWMTVAGFGAAVLAACAGAPEGVGAENENAAPAAAHVNVAPSKDAVESAQFNGSSVTPHAVPGGCCETCCIGNGCKHDCVGEGI